MFSPWCSTLHCLWFHGLKTPKTLMGIFLFHVFQKSLNMTLQRKYILYASENSTKVHGHSLHLGKPKCAKIFHMFFEKYYLILPILFLP